MILFSWIKDNWKKSEAAVVVQNLLELMAAAGLFEQDAAKVANTLVSRVWDSDATLFAGSNGQRPHKLAVAAVAFAYTLDDMPLEGPNVPPFALGLGKILDEVGKNGYRYPFSALDTMLLSGAAGVFTSVYRQLGDTPLGQELEEILARAST